MDAFNPEAPTNAVTNRGDLLGVKHLLLSSPFTVVLITRPLEDELQKEVGLISKASRINKWEKLSGEKMQDWLQRVQRKQ